MKKNAFTMAEVILVMVILGIIATIMITTLKPQSYKDQGLAIQAKKVVSELDGAASRILMNDTKLGNFTELVDPANKALDFKTNATGNGAKLGQLFKKYLTATRTECKSKAQCPCFGEGDDSTSGNAEFFLKDGTCVAIKTGSLSVNSIFPGESDSVSGTATNGRIFIDINGAEEPNALSKDQFYIPLGTEGINYELATTAETTTTSAE